MQLDEVRSHFESWRSLLTDYSRTLICKSLQISHQQFAQRFGSGVETGDDKSSGHFTQATFPPISSTPCELTLQGATRTLSLKMAKVEV